MSKSIVKFEDLIQIEPITKNQKTAISIIRVSGSKSKIVAKKLLRKKLVTNVAHLRNIYSPLKIKKQGFKYYSIGR